MEFHGNFPDPVILHSYQVKIGFFFFRVQLYKVQKKLRKFTGGFFVMARICSTRIPLAESPDHMPGNIAGTNYDQYLSPEFPLVHLLQIN